MVGMGFFGKKKTEEPKIENDENNLERELVSEIEKLQISIKEKQEELENITKRVNTVKEEYDITISNIMIVKKELNQKKMELDIIQREYKEARERNKRAETIKDTRAIDEFNKTEEKYSKMKQELEEFTKKHEEIKEQITQEQTSLHRIRKQHVEVEKELDEANSRLYNAKEELDKKDQFQDTSILTPSEKEFIVGENKNQNSNAGIIEAASAVVGSLKSKLNMTQKELDAVQSLLEKEREAHEKTRKEFEKLKVSIGSVNES